MVKRPILCLLCIIRHLVFTHNFPLSVLKDNDMRMGRTDGCWRSATGISPPGGLPGPTHCLRRFERSDCGCKGVPVLLRIVAHEPPRSFSGAGIVRSLKEVMAYQPSGSAQKGCICLPYTAPELSAGLSLSKALPQGVERENTPRGWLYTGSTLKQVTMLYSSFASSLSRILSSTHRNSFPYSSFNGRMARKRMYPW